MSAPFDHASGDPDLPTVTASGPEMLAAALDLAARGWYLIPLHVPTRFGPQGGSVDRAGCSCRGIRPPNRSKMCVSQAKHGVAWFQRRDPHGEGTSMLTGGITAATTDPTLIECWWTLLPGAGIGVDCRRSGLVVVDIDSDAARGVLRRLVAEHGPLDAWVDLTARGSHHWMTLPKGARPISAASLAPLEIKTGQVTAPPSWHCTGSRNSWVVREGERPPLAPSWMLRPAWPDAARSGRDSVIATPRYHGGNHGTRSALERFLRFVSAVDDADDGRHDLLVKAWFVAGLLAGRGVLDAEWAEGVLVKLTEQCGSKHVANLPGFRSARAAGLAAASRDSEDPDLWCGEPIPQAMPSYRQPRS